jgi:hypothetical protein
MKKILLIILTSLLFGCATKFQPATVHVFGETVLFNGDIYRKSADEFLAVIAAHPVRRVIITSGGGHVGPALDMAEVIFQKKIDVEVPIICLSSCANYIFPAGHNKIISSVGLVGWHGTITHRKHLDAIGKTPIGKSELSLMDGLPEREEQFYQAISTDSFLPWFGKMAPYNVKNFYFLSKEDMELFGMKNIQVRDDYTSSDLSLLIQTKKVGEYIFIKADKAVIESIRPTKPVLH